MITVILTTHDRPDALRNCLQSLLQQSCCPEELVLVNDGPEDLPPDLLALAGKACGLLQVLRPPTASSAASRNAGLRAAHGEVLLFLEDDATIPPTYLATLKWLYTADAERIVAAIGPSIVQPWQGRVGGRMWSALARAIGQGRWGPRVCASRRAVLPACLRGRLVPTDRLPGGGLSLRAEVARSYGFDESLSGYAYGEDRELTFRIAPHHALYVAPELTLHHHAIEGGRGGMVCRGRHYVRRTLQLAWSIGGAGVVLLACWELVGMALLHLAWAVPGRQRRQKWQFVSGMLREVLAISREAVCRSCC